MPVRTPQRLQGCRGFTLVEVMMVVAVVVVLAAVVIPKIGAARKEAKFVGVLHNANTVRATLEILIGRGGYRHAPDGPQQFAFALIEKLDALDGTRDGRTDAANPYNGSRDLIKGSQDDDWDD
jgi:prepilin-type N-terminal cleavage/methylation domain-containing protein